MAEPVDLSVLPIGTVLDDRYEVIECIGAGATGTVYRVRQLKVGRDVALKVLNHQALSDEEMVQRFETEAQIIGQLRHPNTLKLIDFGQFSGGRMYTIIELLDGKPLDKVLKGKKALEPLRVMRILRQIADSLVEAHAKEIIHRDLKPGNIFIEEIEGQEVAKVLDFGIAKLNHASTQTATGTVFGTPAYMAPEQARGKRVTGQSDLYSLGVIAFECLSGVRPFHADSPMGLLYKQVHDAPPPLRPFVGPGPLGDELCVLVMRLLLKDPNERPEGAERLRNELRSLEIRYSDAEAVRSGDYSVISQPSLTIDTPAELPVDASASELGVTDPEAQLLMSTALEAPRSSSTLKIAGVGMALLLAAGIGIFLFSRSGAEPVQTKATPEPPPASKEQKKTVALTSDPLGADVIDTNTKETLGKTPLQLEVEEARQVTIRMDGYQAQSITLDRHAPKQFISLAKVQKPTSSKKKKKKKKEKKKEETRPPDPQPVPEPDPESPKGPLKKGEARPW